VGGGRWYTSLRTGAGSRCDVNPHSSCLHQCATASQKRLLPVPLFTFIRATHDSHSAISSIVRDRQSSSHQQSTSLVLVVSRSCHLRAPGECITPGQSCALTRFRALLYPYFATRKSSVRWPGVDLKLALIVLSLLGRRRVQWKSQRNPQQIRHVSHDQLSSHPGISRPPALT
jgi:hypothetical protein